ncbi:DUF3465 domain-containing protein [Stenoxybacter acetivorans]|uniref:DUF3465 domain-containing protein n=1 Tax=Stenoxybacter acetivorans TaxID=422441 RepID=UPI00055E1E45|nr:DUF3465 domain-containing protein [Stenoxybacter acetivorans]
MNLRTLIFLAIIGFLLWDKFGDQIKSHPKVNQTINAVLPDKTAANTSNSSNNAIYQAFTQQRSNVQVLGKGLVSKTLPDDNKGSRHQRFIVKLDNQQTVLIAHNIDLAPRLPNLKKGDEVAFFGEYEYSPQGGVIHWTHHDPNNRHEGGWLEFRGQRYQ